MGKKKDNDWRGNGIRFDGSKVKGVHVPGVMKTAPKRKSGKKR